MIKTKTITPKLSANALTKHVLYLLKMKGVFAWRQNNGGVYDPTKKVFRANSSMRGVPDIIGYKNTDGAKFIAIEIKVGKDKLSIHQDTFLNNLNKAGGIGRVIRNLEDLENLIKEL